MKWNVIFDPDFKLWFYQQELELQDEVFSVLTLLMEFGPSLGRPRVDTFLITGDRAMVLVWQ